MRNEEMLKDMLNENFVEVSKEQQENINGGGLSDLLKPVSIAVAYGIVGFIPRVTGGKK